MSNVKAFVVLLVALLAANGAYCFTRMASAGGHGLPSKIPLHLGQVFEPSAYGGVNPVTYVHESSIRPAVIDGVPVWNYTTVIEIADNLVVPSGPEDCNPASPAIAPDGIPYLASRTHVFHDLSEPNLREQVSAKTGIRSFTVDYNPCGHPPVGVFTVPHFDIHFYYMTNDERLAMQCGGDILCFENGPNPKFFELPEGNANLGVNFSKDPSNVGVAEMGLHWWDQPTPTPWEEVTLIMGTYAGAVNFWELMFPAFGVPTGSARDIAYQNQTMAYLPTGYDVNYDGKRMAFSLYINKDDM